MFSRITPPLALQHVASNRNLRIIAKISVSPLNSSNTSPPNVQLACAAEQRTQCKHQQTRQHTSITVTRHCKKGSQRGLSGVTEGLSRKRNRLKGLLLSVNLVLFSHVAVYSPAPSECQQHVQYQCLCLISLQ